MKKAIIIILLFTHMSFAQLESTFQQPLVWCIDCGPFTGLTPSSPVYDNYLCLSWSFDRASYSDSRYVLNSINIDGGYQFRPEFQIIPGTPGQLGIYGGTKYDSVNFYYGGTGYGGNVSFGRAGLTTDEMYDLLHNYARYSAYPAFFDVTIQDNIIHGTVDIGVYAYSTSWGEPYDRFIGTVTLEFGRGSSVDGSVTDPEDNPDEDPEDPETETKLNNLGIQSYLQDLKPSGNSDIDFGISMFVPTSDLDWSSVGSYNFFANNTTHIDTRMSENNAYLTTGFGSAGGALKNAFMVLRLASKTICSILIGIAFIRAVANRIANY